MIISGKLLALEIKQKIKAEVQQLNFRKPHLVVIIVGCDPGSTSYVKAKEKAALEVGFKSTLIRLDEMISEDHLLKMIKEINQDNNVDGLLVQLPLPKHINEELVIKAISIDKDVDGFHPLNVAALSMGYDCILPCTPKGIITMLKSKNIEIQGKRAVVVGRSNIVGKPIAQLLLANNATVTICHSKTKDLKAELLNADIVIAAIGKPKFITKDMIKDQAVVIDVGVNRVDGFLCGDVDFEGVMDKASFITPVPGGVGPMTIASLLENTYTIYKRKVK